MKVLVTGCAGFIGMHTCLSLLKRGDEVVGVDNLNNYYYVSLKHDRLNQLSKFKNFIFFKLDITSTNDIFDLFAKNQFERVIHLAAQAGVRYSLKNPHIYIQSNLLGLTNILEGCRFNNVKHLVFASSSSVYGANEKVPFSVTDNVDHPVSLYAATKKSGELIAHSYAHLYNLSITCLRFFTVYGPWGRPDMAPWLFTEAIYNGKSIDIFNEGKMWRDFTYIDDIVEGVVRVLDKPANSDSLFNKSKPNPSTSYAPYRIYNIGNHMPVELMFFINTIENLLQKKAIKNMLPMQAGDVLTTYADTSELRQDFEFSPSTSLQSGMEKFVDWYISYKKNTID